MNQKKKIIELKELHNYYMLKIMGQFDCSYESDELMNFMEYLNDKYGIFNIDTDPNDGTIGLMNLDLEDMFMMAKRIKTSKCRNVEEYLISTLKKVSREIIDFYNVHKKDKYTEDTINRILD